MANHSVQPIENGLRAQHGIHSIRVSLLAERAVPRDKKSDKKAEVRGAPHRRPEQSVTATRRERVTDRAVVSRCDTGPGFGHGDLA